MVDPTAVHWVSRMAETSAKQLAAGSACWMVDPMASHWDLTSAAGSAQLRADSKAVQSEDATAVLSAVLLAGQLAPYSVLRWGNWYRLAVSDDWYAATSWALHSAVP